MRALSLAEHLLGRLETSDNKIKVRISTLQRGVRALIHMHSVGHIQAAEFGLHLISPGIDEVILAIKDSTPLEEWPTEPDLSIYEDGGDNSE